MILIPEARSRVGYLTKQTTVACREGSLAYMICIHVIALISLYMNSVFDFEGGVSIWLAFLIFLFFYFFQLFYFDFWRVFLLSPL